MSALVLLLLVGGAFAVQYNLDVRCIRALASERGWALLGILWTPSLLRSRWERSYWVRYRAEDGRLERRLCRLVNPFGGAHAVALEPAIAAEARAGDVGARPRLARPVLVVACALGGAFAGAALGILACFALYPGSNIAPAYGVIYGTPAGLVAGAAFAFLRGR